MRESESSPFRVAIVGGGYAGFAAAVELASQGTQVQLFEAGPVLGGRARCITYRDLALDNGAHILLGAGNAGSDTSTSTSVRPSVEITVEAGS